jgi:hypothetical protein
MVVTEAREALAGVEVQVGVAGGVVEVGAARGGVLLVKAEDPQDVDERRVQVARRQLERLVPARRGVGDDPEGVGCGSWFVVGVGGDYSSRSGGGRAPVQLPRRSPDARSGGRRARDTAGAGPGRSWPSGPRAAVEFMPRPRATAQW